MPERSWIVLLMTILRESAEHKAPSPAKGWTWHPLARPPHPSREGKEMRCGMTARVAVVCLSGQSCFLFLLPAAGFQQQPTVNPNALIIQDFEHRIAEYGKLRKNIKGGLSPLKPTASPPKIAYYQHELAHRILEARQFGNYQG